MKKEKIVLIVLLCIGLLPIGFVSAQAPASVEMQALITQLQEQIKTLQIQLADLKSKLKTAEKETIVTKQELVTVKQEVAQLRLTRSLQRGARGDDVRELQQFLSQFPDIYPEKLITGFFGFLTEAAVKKFQEKHGITDGGTIETTGYGQIGPKTLQKINEIHSVREEESREAGADNDARSRADELIVCHIPPGNTTAQHSLQIARSALEAHLAHGDSKGVCPGTPSLTGTTTALFVIPATTTVPFVPPATSTSASTPATPAIPAEPIGQTGITTVPAIPAQPAQPAQISTSTTDALPPSVPTNFTALSTSYSVWLYWSKSTDNIGVVGYKLYRNSILIFSAATSSSLATLAYSDYSLTPGTVYNYAVAAYDAAGNVSAQAVISITTASLPNTSPSPSPSSSPSPSPSPSPPPPASGYTYKWSFYAGTELVSNPAIGPDGTVYISANTKLLAINPDGTQKWAFNFGSTATYNSPAVGDDGTIYIAELSNKLYAINPDGSKKWEFATSGSQINSTPSLGSDGTIYIAEVSPGKLYAVNPDGSKKWEFVTSDSALYNSAVGSDGVIYAGGYSKLYAINPNGTQKWTFASGTQSSPAI